MIARLRRTGRSWFRPARFVLLAGIVAAAFPLLRPVVVTEHPAEVLRPDHVAPEGPARLLWFAGRATASSEGRTVFLDDGGGVLEADARLHLQRIALALGERELLSVSPAPAGGLWVTDARGGVLRVTRDGAVTRIAQEAFSYPQVRGDDRGGAWLVRSPSYFSYRWDSAGAPLLLRLDESGSTAIAVGTAVVPEHALLRDLANAGTVVASGDTVFYVPFIRDEVLALSPAGDTLWLARRGLPQSTVSPRFEVREGRVEVDYHPVNLGAALGPDGRLYVLSTPGLPPLRVAWTSSIRTRASFSGPRHSRPPPRPSRWTQRAACTCWMRCGC